MMTLLPIIIRAPGNDPSNITNELEQLYYEDLNCCRRLHHLICRKYFLLLDLQGYLWFLGTRAYRNS